MKRCLFRAVVAASVVFSPLVFGGPVRAQPAQPVTLDPQAAALFKEARELMDKGQFAEACPKFEESQRIQPGIGTLFNLSDCYEKQGRTASAWSGFSDAATAADAAGQKDRAQAARERAVALSPRLSKLRIVVPPVAQASGLEVQRNSVAVARLLWGADVPVDPASYTVTAQAPGKVPWSATVEVKEPGKVVAVEVPALKLEGPAFGDPSSDAPAPWAPAPWALAPVPSVEKRSVVPAVVLGGVAAVGIGSALGMFIAANGRLAHGEAITSQIVAARGTCRQGGAEHSRCEELASTKSTISTLDGLAFGAVVLGGVALAGVVVYLVLPEPAARPGETGVTVRVAPTAGGVQVSGSF